MMSRYCLAVAIAVTGLAFAAPPAAAQAPFVDQTVQGGSCPTR
jgi:hypothetical protein